MEVSQFSVNYTFLINDRYFFYRLCFRVLTKSSFLKFVNNLYFLRFLFNRDLMIVPSCSCIIISSIIQYWQISYWSENSIVETFGVQSLSISFNQVMYNWCIFKLILCNILFQHLVFQKRILARLTQCLFYLTI